MCKPPESDIAEFDESDAVSYLLGTTTMGNMEDYISTTVFRAQVHRKVILNHSKSPKLAVKAIAMRTVIAVQKMRKKSVPMRSGLTRKMILVFI